MAYWVLVKLGPIDGREKLHAELFDTRMEALVYSKVQQADRGRETEIVEAYECAGPDCEDYPEWGYEFCEECRPDPRRQDSEPP